MSKVICTAVFRQGDEYAEWTGVGESRTDAFYSAATDQSHVGLIPNPPNRRSAVELLTRYEREPWDGPQVKEGYAYLRTNEQGQVQILIGWVTYTFTDSVRLWAISAQVEIQRPAEKGWSEGWNVSRQVPTFYLDPLVQGILTEAGAVKIAEDILSTAGPVDDADVTLHVTATPIY